ncbi:Aliphatic sulfonates import ATP-binding protein SsuB [Serratia fonticola]|uniref:Aliphatic sulfonates import ATP-binding protein SsuB n=1 Tax=Serratia fonticola TaxID=47917 RepID=A0A4U9UXY1_SERFO|nr:Aliphatic sulfonates import ATP-binding protein SsuB [Serratia fonticola]
MTAPTRIPQGTPITLEAIAKRYGNRTVLDDLQLRITAGQFVAVVGRSGCGKAPYCACSQGWKRPTAGHC